MNPQTVPPSDLYVDEFHCIVCGQTYFDVFAHLDLNQDDRHKDYDWCIVTGVMDTCFCGNKMETSMYGEGWTTHCSNPFCDYIGSEA